MAVTCRATCTTLYPTIVVVTGASGGSNTKQHSIRRTIDTEEEARASMYRGALIYAEPFPAWRHTNLVCGYDSSTRHMRTVSACVLEPSQSYRFMNAYYKGLSVKTAAWCVKN